MSERNVADDPQRTDPVGPRSVPVLTTPRLDLIAATPEAVEAALESSEALGRVLGATVPPSWPPEFLDVDAFRYTLARLRENPAAARWWLYLIVLRDEKVLIGSGGFKGPPLLGQVEIGYGIVADRHRCGYASEAAQALVESAFADPTVDQVIAETLPELVGSIGVLARCGFRFLGEGSEPNVIRYALDRPVEPEPR